MNVTELICESVMKTFLALTERKVLKHSFILRQAHDLLTLIYEQNHKTRFQFV